MNIHSENISTSGTLETFLKPLRYTFIYEKDFLNIIIYSLNGKPYVPYHWYPLLRW